VSRRRRSGTRLDGSNITEPSGELVLTHRRLPPAKVDAHRKGWTDIVRKLGETLATTSR
jgi:hypothetical protein